MAGPFFSHISRRNSGSCCTVADMTITVSTSGGNVMVGFTATVQHTQDKKYGDYALFVDGTEEFRVRQTISPVEELDPVSINYLVTGLSSGSHTFEIRWRSESGSNTVQQNAASWGTGRTLSVVELAN